MVIIMGRSHPKYEYITAQWGGMDVRHEFSERIERWLCAFSEEERPLLLNLLGHFLYYSEKRIKEKACILYEKFSKEYGEEKNVVYIPTIKQYGVGYSSLFFDNFWLVNDLYDYAERNIISMLKEDIVPEKIAIVDDYSGTGNTIVTTLTELICANERIRSAQIYVIVQHITKRALEFLQSASSSLSLKLHVIYLDYSEEAFKPDYLFERVESEKKRLSYESICHRLDIEESNMLGYEEVQSLVAFYYNTPNNTLGLFWKDLNEFTALFSRHRKQRTQLAELQRKAKNQANLRKTKPVVRGFDDRRISAFLAYCVSQDKGFSFEKAREDFVMTLEQMRTLIDTLLQQEYLSSENGVFRATPKTKEISFRSRFKELKKAFSNEYEKKYKNLINPDIAYIPTDF